MLDEPELILDICRKVRDMVKCPVMVKLRTGVTGSAESLENFWHIIENIADTGVDLVVVHGRSVGKRYRGNADWEILRKVKQKLPNMLVGGSGDVFSARAAYSLIHDIGMDIVAVARGAIGNPWLFSQIRAKFLGVDEPANPTLTQQAIVMRHHYDMISKLYPEVKGVCYFRKFVARYCKLHPQRKKALVPMMNVKRAKDLLGLINEHYESDT